MKIHRIILRSGEEIEIRELESGSVCPVCGFVQHGEAPYGWCQTVLEDGVSLGEAFGAPSFDVCPSCNVEYGNDDYFDGRTVKSMWDQLRIEWLDRVGWSMDALNQLRENLGLSDKVIGQHKQHRS